MPKLPMLHISVINQNVTFAEAYYKDFMLKLSTLIMNVFISVRLGFLNIELCIDNILTYRILTYRQHLRAIKIKKINLRYKYLKRI